MGFVGEALYNGIKTLAPQLMGGIGVFDPYKLPDSSLNDVLDKKFIFICVPTPMNNGGEIDDSIVDDVLSQLNDNKVDGIVVIKSTLLPTSVTKFIDKYPSLNIATNPEFLTERRANQDFIDSEWIFIGGDDSSWNRIYDLYSVIYKDASQKIDYAYVSPEAAMMAKYMTNVWFSVKVSLMNEYYELWDKLGHNDWDDVVKAFSLDKRVGPTHLQVPGPDGDFGFGGKCFPKDLNALMHLAASSGTTNDVMNAAWGDNKHFRRNKDWLNIEGAVSENYNEV
jgi:UDPglucose 6-dehydrogenase